METIRMLVVDDEKNIRFTLSKSLEDLGTQVRAAVNGEDALRMLHDEEYSLVFLDLKLPGMDGLEVLRRIREEHPRVRVVIISAHGSIDTAVDAMKLGAVDFIQKPFSPDEIRGIAAGILARENLDESSADDYPSLIEIAKRRIADRDFAAARVSAERAIALDPARAEAYNLVGVVLEIRGLVLEAQKFYRAASDIDPTYRPAWANLERVTGLSGSGRIELDHRENGHRR